MIAMARVAAAAALTVAVLGSFGSRSPDGPHRGWAAIVDSGAHCVVSVPADWRTDHAAESPALLVASPDGRATAALNWSVEPGIRARLKAALRPILVHADAAERLWFEYAVGSPGQHSLMLVPADGGQCALYVDVAEDGDSTLRALARDVIQTLSALH